MASGLRTFWWLMPLLSAALGAGLTLWMNHATVLEWNVCFTEGSLLAALLVVSMAAAFLLINAYPTKVGLLIYAIAIALIIGIVVVWLHGAIAAAIEGPRYLYWINQTLPYRAMLYPAALLLLCVTIAMRRRVHELEERYALQQDAAALLKEAELFKLRHQLQPHFLFNSLNAISSLIITAPPQAEEMINRLSDFLRASVRQGHSDTVPLEEELAYLRNYLWIEAARFGERLRVEWNEPEAAPGAHLPPFLLQPLLENAIKFGLYGRTGNVSVSVSIMLSDGLLCISVANPFDATAAPARGTGFGLESIRRRLYLMYMRQDLLKTTVADDIFTVTILIPQ